jgi:hypothetical protein
MKLLNQLCWGLFFLLLFSCNSTQKTDNVTSTEPDVAVKKSEVGTLPPPTASRGTDILQKKLEEFFTEAQRQQLKSVEKAFSNIQTAEDLAFFYQKTLPEVVALMDKKINQYDPETTSSNDSPVEKWAWFTDYMPYISVELFCSECGVEAYIVLNPLRDKAELTAGKVDDTFFDALLTTYKDVNGSDKNKICDKTPNNWINLVNCDLCGADILGNNKHLNALTAIFKAQKEGSLFSNDLAALKQQALPNQATNYYYPKAEVLKELEAIIALSGLTSKEKESLKNIRYLLNVGKEVQFDCQKGNCQFLAM